jgi:predicted RNA binding protein YcfA (HicA-like mRNA interferase family)
LSKTRVYSGKELCKIFSLIGYFIDHQTGSHFILRNSNYPFRRLTIPNHKEIAIGTLKNILKQAGITLEELYQLEDL